jgi:hypothetical protein
MITLDELSSFLQELGLANDDIESELRNFDSIIEVASKAQRIMPSIGFVSVAGRLNCFEAVCRYLDEATEAGQISLGESQVVLMILRLKNKTFLKAISMFDVRGVRYGLRERAELPRSAREYLAGILTYG